MVAYLGPTRIQRAGGHHLTYIITSPCVDVMDKSCVEVCPVDCIHYEDGPDRMLYIDPEECIDCGACVDPCPVDAIYAEEDVPKGETAFIEINHLYFKDRKTARAKVDQLAPAILGARESC